LDWPWPGAFGYSWALVAVLRPDTFQESAIPLDYRSPLVLDTRELGRSPGSTIAVSRTVPAPQDLSSELIGFPAGTELALTLQLAAVMEGVVVSGSVAGRATGQCGRCLTEFEREIRTHVTELFVYNERPHHRKEREQDDEELPEDQYELEGDLIDFEPVLRDAVVPALPFQPVCRVDCPGLCSECGARLAEDPDHHHDVVDPRWAALQGLAAAGGGPSDPEEEN
jgi:uncharacterized protein